MLKDSYILFNKTKNKIIHPVAAGMNPGPIDAVKVIGEQVFAVEWETNNISSSHRALNKLAVGIIQKQIVGEILILPARNFSKYLTDRVGNYQEISPYFPLYSVIGVIGIEHDGLDLTSPIIPIRKRWKCEKRHTGYPLK